MAGRITEVLDRLEARQQEPPIPDDIPILELAEQVVRGKIKLSPPQMRMLIELLPYHAPKLSAMAVSSMSENDFASRLDRAIARSLGPKLIEGRVERDGNGS